MTTSTCALHASWSYISTQPDPHAPLYTNRDVTISPLATRSPGRTLRGTASKLASLASASAQQPTTCSVRSFELARHQKSRHLSHSTVNGGCTPHFTPLGQDWFSSSFFPFLLQPKTKTSVTCETTRLPVPAVHHPRYSQPRPRRRNPRRERGDTSPRIRTNPVG